MQAVKHVYQTYNSGRMDTNWMEPTWFNSNINFRKSWELKAIYWIPDLFDLQWNFLSRDQIEAFFHFAINSVDYGNLRFLVRKRLESTILTRQH